MTPTDKQRKRLINLLEELFQLDQPDLDFGFYKIMHAKSETVSNFVQKDLLQIVKGAFGEADEAREKEARLEYEQVREKAISFGSPDPDAAEPVQTAKANYDAAKDSSANEGEIYEHLYRFFERYYDNGDFMSRRYFARETSGKAAPYAVPYDGREVYLHWANRDQYYIKTSEYLKNFTFDIAKHWQKKEERILANIPETLKLHCRIVEATEGEHNNNKATDETERFFLIYADKPAIMEDGELVLQFEYRPDLEKSGQTQKWQEKRIGEAQKVILNALSGISEAESYSQALRIEIGEDKSKRPLLRKYLNQYTKRNTMDYFIHKDLDSFLKRELDFYIKNEIMRLDDIESADAPKVQTYLNKIKVLRKIAGHLIAFLAQLEDFQKKLWLKKKFVTETQYCMTLDRIPEHFYSEIAANDAQRNEWVSLFAIDELKGYSTPLKVNFLKINRFLVLDTKFFPASFKDTLLASIQDLDENLDGLLIHSENFQALESIKLKYYQKLQYIYIDPPYNTNSTPILYKNSYKHSSWISLMQDRLDISLKMLKNNGVKTFAIDDTELANLAKLLENACPEHKISKVTVIHNPKGSITKDFNRVHEYAIFLTKHDVKGCIARTLEKNEKPRRMRRWGENSLREERRPSFYPIYVKNGKITRIGSVPKDDFHPSSKNVQIENGEVEIWPIDQDGIERRWNFGLDSIHSNLERIKILKTSNKLDLFLTHEETVPKTVWYGGDFDAGNHGNTLLINILGKKLFDFPKSIKLLERCVSISTEHSENPIVLDYFAGSGTTGHAVINLNRKDNKKRKYIMAEMGRCFHIVTKPRIQKIIYSKDWKDGKPVSREGISHAFKYIYLESYEDTLNNLIFREDTVRDKALQLNHHFRQDYMLKYWLDFETKRSSSLLNIDQFNDPTSYMLKLKKPGSDEYAEKAVDVIESFNWLIGLHIDHLDQWRSYSSGNFTREPDPELPDDNATRLTLDGPMEEIENGKWRFRKVVGRVCRTPGDMRITDRVLIIWRKLTDNLEEDNLMLDEWFNLHYKSVKDRNFDLIYVNGSNNLQLLCTDSESWKVRLIEETFHRQMWDVEG